MELKNTEKLEHSVVALTIEITKAEFDPPSLCICAYGSVVSITTLSRSVMRPVILRRR